MRASNKGKELRSKGKELLKRFKEEHSHPELTRPWQTELTEYLNRDPDRRTIFWVYGPEGNEGKTEYAKALMKKGWFYTGEVNVENALLMYAMTNPGANVVIDIRRSMEDQVDYSLMEILKDRILEITKYMCCTIPLLNKIHVVVMANFLPKENVYCGDRLVIIKC